MSNKEKLNKIYSICNIGIFEEFDERELIIKAYSNNVNMDANEVYLAISEEVIREISTLFGGVGSNIVNMSLNINNTLNGLLVYVSIDIVGEIARVVNYLTCDTKGISSIPKVYSFNENIYNETISALGNAKQFILKAISEIQQ